MKLTLTVGQDQPRIRWMQWTSLEARALFRAWQPPHPTLFGTAELTRGADFALVGLSYDPESAGRTHVGHGHGIFHAGRCCDKRRLLRESLCRESPHGASEEICSSYAEAPQGISAYHRQGLSPREIVSPEFQPGASLKKAVLRDVEQTHWRLETCTSPSRR